MKHPKEPQHKIKKVGARSPRSHRHIHKGVSWTLVVLWLISGAMVGLLALRLAGGRVQAPAATVSVQPAPIDWLIKNSTELTTGHGPLAPPDGYKFLVVDLELVNHSRYTYDFAPVNQTFVQGSSGKIFQMSPAEIPNPINAGPIKSGQTVSGQLSYLVPANEKRFSFVFLDTLRGVDQHTQIDLP